MPTHHYEIEGDEPTEANRLQTVRCIYCGEVDARQFAAMDEDSPTPMSVRIRAARTIPVDAGCSEAPGS